MSLAPIDSDNVVLLGAGGHARSILGLLKTLNKRVLGCIAPVEPTEGWPKDCRWLGDDKVLDTLDPSQLVLVNGLGSVGSTALRREVFEEARARGFRIPTLLHPSAILADDVVIEEGSQVLAGAVLQAGVVVAKNALLNTGCIVDHNCVIGAHAHIAPGAALSGNVRVGSGVHLGASAVVLQGIQIGAGSIVGAGAVVTRDVPPTTTLLAIRLVQQPKSMFLIEVSGRFTKLCRPLRRNECQASSDLPLSRYKRDS